MNDGAKLTVGRPDINKAVIPSTQITSTAVKISDVTNGNFSNLAGLTQTSSEWLGGLPTGWAGNNTNYGIYRALGSNNYIANIGELSSGPSGSSFRQALGYLPVTSDVELTFTYSEPFGDAALGAAIYDANYVTLATDIYTTPGAYTLTGSSIVGGTYIIIGFWSAAGNSALDNVSVAQTTTCGTWILPTNLPTTFAGLPSGALYINSAKTLKVNL